MFAMLCTKAPINQFRLFKWVPTFILVDQLTNEHLQFNPSSPQLCPDSVCGSAQAENKPARCGGSDKIKALLLKGSRHDNCFISFISFS